MNTLKRDWNSKVTLAEILIVIYSHSELTLDNQVTFNRSQSNFSIERRCRKITPGGLSSLLCARQIVHRNSCHENETKKAETISSKTSAQR